MILTLFYLFPPLLSPKNTTEMANMASSRDERGQNCLTGSVLWGPRGCIFRPFFPIGNFPNMFKTVFWVFFRWTLKREASVIIIVAIINTLICSIWHFAITYVGMSWKLSCKKKSSLALKCVKVNRFLALTIAKSAP